MRCLHQRAGARNQISVTGAERYCCDRRKSRCWFPEIVDVAGDRISSNGEVTSKTHTRLSDLGYDGWPVMDAASIAQEITGTGNQATEFRAIDFEILLDTDASRFTLQALSSGTYTLDLQARGS